MEKHTPTPWHVEHIEEDAITIGGAFGYDGDPKDWRVVADTGSVTDEDQANAERIVACANACAGIPTEALTPGSIRALIDIVTSTTDALGELRANDFADGDSFAAVFSSLQKLTNAVATFKPAQTEPAPIDPNELADILELIDEEYPPDVIAGWTDAQREEVAGWAGAVFLKASDNPVKVPPKPDFMTR